MAINRSYLSMDGHRTFYICQPFETTRVVKQGEMQA